MSVCAVWDCNIVTRLLKPNFERGRKLKLPLKPVWHIHFFLGNAIHCLSASTYFVAAVFMADAARSAHTPHAPPAPDQ